MRLVVDEIPARAQPSTCASDGNRAPPLEFGYDFVFGHLLAWVAVRRKEKLFSTQPGIEEIKRL